MNSRITFNAKFFQKSKPNAREMTWFWKKRENCHLRLSKGLNYFVEGKLRQRKKERLHHTIYIKGGKWTHYLDVFLEISFRWSLLDLRLRYSLPSRMGKKRRFLEHMWHTPFIHSVQFVITSHFFEYINVYQLFLPNGTWRCVLLW